MPYEGEIVVNDLPAGGTPAPTDKVMMIDNTTGDLKLFTAEALGSIVPVRDGITEEIKQALLQLAQKVAYVDADGQLYYNELYHALYPGDIVSITAQYDSTHQVFVGDSLDSLKPYLTVTAQYDDDSTTIVTTYTLSGDTSTAGSTNITVTYRGKTDTFTINVVMPVPVFQLMSPTNVNDYDTEIELFDTPKSFTIVCDFTFNNYSWGNSYKSLFGHTGFRLGHGTIDDYVDGSVIASNTERYTALVLNPSSVTNHYRGTALVGRTNGEQTKRFAIRYNHSTRKLEGFVAGDPNREVPTKAWFIASGDIVFTDGRTVKLNLNSSGSTANEFEIYLNLLSDNLITAFLNGE